VAVPPPLENNNCWFLKYSVYKFGMLSVGNNKCVTRWTQQWRVVWEDLFHFHLRYLQTVLWNHVDRTVKKQLVSSYMNWVTKETPWSQTQYRFYFYLLNVTPFLVLSIISKWTLLPGENVKGVSDIVYINTTFVSHHPFPMLSLLFWSVFPLTWLPHPFLVFPVVFWLMYYQIWMICLQHILQCPDQILYRYVFQGQYITLNKKYMKTDIHFLLLAYKESQCSETGSVSVVRHTWDGYPAPRSLLGLLSLDSECRI
jgi:hypothetical protein